MENNFITIDKDIRGGQPVFKNTRIPVSYLMDHIEKGWTTKDLKIIFPTIKTKWITYLIQSKNK